LNSVVFLKELWRRKLLVALAFLFSAAVAVLIVYHVSPSPPFLEERNQIEAEGSIQVLVDSANSPIANARFELGGLTARAGVFARLMSSGDVIRQVSKETGIPEKKIDVAGPLPLPGEAPGVSEGPARENPFKIEVTQQSELPILTVSTRAPTLEEARALAAATPRAMSQQIEAIQDEQETPEGKRVVLRRLGPAQTGVVDNSAGKKIAIGAFFFLMAVFITLIVGMPRFVRAWKATDLDSPADGGAVGAEVPEPELAPEPAAEAAEPKKRRRRGRRRKGAAKANGAKQAEDAQLAEAASTDEARADKQLDLESQLDEEESSDGLPSIAVLTKAFAGETEGNGNGHAKDAVRD
jgi:hypothetical protein